MTTSRSFHTGTLLKNGQVLLTGGQNTAGAFLDTAELYDPATGSFVSTGSMTDRRNHHGAALLPNGQVLIVGGTNGSTTGNLDTAEIYDPEKGQFSRL